MLKKTQKITLEGESYANDVSLAGFRATIDSDNPNDAVIAVWQNDKNAYKANRDIAREDQAEFEDYAYQKQDELIATQTTNISEEK